MMTDFFTDTYTIINQVPVSADTATKNVFIKNKISHCCRRSGIYDKSSETIIFKRDSWTVRSKDWKRFRQPTFENGGYYSLNDKSGCFTANSGDLLIFAEINDPAPESIAEFKALADKYKGMGGVITGTEVFINYRSDGKPWETNHIKFIRS